MNLVAAQLENMSKHKDLWDGAIYNANSAVQYTLNRKIIESYSFRGDERMLDVGCGDGATSALLASLVPHGEVIGIDVSTSMIQFASGTYPKVHPNVQFVCQNADGMDYHEEFDVVTSFFMLHWVEDLQTILTKMHGALKPGGRILLFYPILHLHPWHNLVLKEMKETNWGERYEQLLPKTSINGHGQRPNDLLNQLRHCCHEEYELSELCQQVGFRDVMVEINNHTYTFVNENECVVWFEALITMINEPENEAEQHLVQTLLRKIIQQFHQNDSGNITIHWTCALIQGSK